MNWRSAFYHQAESDFFVYLDFNKSKKHPVCHRLHYLQMATEKLAKSFNCPSNGSPPQTVHQALVKFLQNIRLFPPIRKKLGYDSNREAFQAYIRSLTPIAYQIESLAPIGGNKANINPEYPWLDKHGNVCCPASYSFPAFDKVALAKFHNLIVNLFPILKPD